MTGEGLIPMGWFLAVVPPGIEPGTAAALMGVSLVASLITVVAGIGGGGLLLAILASLMPPVALIPVHGAIQVGSNLVRSALMLRHMVWAIFPGFALGTAVGAGLGGMVAVSLPAAWVQIGVGGFILFTILGKAPAMLRNWGFATGVISSFLTMFFGATGLFVAAFTKAQALPRHRHVAVHGTLMTLQHGLKTAIFAGLGFAFAPWLPFIAAMILFGALGTLIGKRLLGSISDARFKLLLDVVLGLLALRLIWSGLRGL